MQYSLTGTIRLCGVDLVTTVKIMGLPGEKVFTEARNELHVHQNSGLKVDPERTLIFGQCNHPYI